MEPPNFKRGHFIFFLSFYISTLSIRTRAGGAKYTYQKMTTKPLFKKEFFLIGNEVCNFVIPAKAHPTSKRPLFISNNHTQTNRLRLKAHTPHVLLLMMAAKFKC